MPYEVSWIAKDGETERVTFGTANLAFPDAVRLINAGYSPTVKDKSSGATYIGKAIFDVYETVKSGAMKGNK